MKSFRIAVKSFIVNKKNELLIIKRRSNDIQKPNAWEIPGGRLEPGENPYSGIKRETKEEIGLDIKVLYPLNIKHFIRNDKQTITMIIFICKAIKSQIILSEEHQDYEWVHINEAKEKIGEFFHKDVDTYKKLELHKLF